MVVSDRELNDTTDTSTASPPTRAGFVWSVRYPAWATSTSAIPPASTPVIASGRAYLHGVSGMSPASR